MYILTLFYRNYTERKIIMENISIRQYIIDSFKGDNESEIRESIDDTIKEGLEEALP